MASQRTKMVRASFYGYARGDNYYEKPRLHTVDVLADTPAEALKILRGPGGYQEITGLQFDVLYDSVVLRSRPRKGWLRRAWQHYTGFDLWALPLVLLAGGATGYFGYLLARSIWIGLVGQ